MKECEIGEYDERRPWGIVENYVHSEVFEPDKPPKNCKHVEVLEMGPHFSMWQYHYLQLRIPRAVLASCNNRHSGIVLCLDCILEAKEKAK